MQLILWHCLPVQRTSQIDEPAAWIHSKLSVVLPAKDGIHDSPVIPQILVHGVHALHLAAQRQALRDLGHVVLAGEGRRVVVLVKDLHGHGGAVSLLGQPVVCDDHLEGERVGAELRDQLLPVQRGFGEDKPGLGLHAEIFLVLLEAVGEFGVATDILAGII